MQKSVTGACIPRQGHAAHSSPPDSRIWSWPHLAPLLWLLLSISHPPTLPWKAQNCAICPVLTLIFQNIICHLPKGSLPGSSGYTPVCPGSCPAFTLDVGPQQLPLAQPFNSKDCILHVSKLGKRRTVTFLAGIIMKVAFN